LTCEGRIEGPLDEEIARPSPGKYAVFAVGPLDSALTQDGRLECAGETLSDGPYVAVSSSGYLAVSTRCCGSAISNRICALTPAGAVDCWSLDLAGDLSILTAVPEETAKRPARGHYTAISVGAAHACALINDGHVECWGTDQAVLLPEPTSRTSEGAVSGSPQDGGYTAVSAGNGYTCAIDSDGVAECWGYDEFGQVSGDKPHERGYVAISAGFRAACALTREGEVDCWGGDEYGQATDPKPRQGQYVAVSVGWSVACALTRSGAYDCWGQQYFSSDGPVWSASAL